jgi:hypothetical protein
MNPLIQLKNVALVFLVALVCFGLLPTMQAVVPAPDGGYAGGNTAEGQNALFSLTTGGFNTAVGLFSLRTDTTGQLNTAIGAGTLLFNIADDNTATGAGALLNNTIGTQNTANGAFALSSNPTGSNNTATGSGALGLNTIGSDNTANGQEALGFNTTGGGNTALGVDAGLGVTTASNVICIGTGGLNMSNSCYIGQIFAQPVNPATATAVFVDASGKLGTSFSSRRFKHDIKPMDKSSQAILALKPVTFHYKNDVKSTPCFGLVAEDVEKVNPNLVVHDKNGELLSVRYDAVNAMLLNEFLKEHHEVQELKATVAQQQKQIEALTAGLQKVSAQLELNKSEPQTVLNNQ